jgi:hypothetical protein
MHRMSACILVVMAGVSFGNAASAQRSGASIDAGALNMRYADSVNANAIALTPAMWIESSRATLSATGTISQFIDGGWSAQANAAGSVFTRRRSLFLGEVEGSAGGSTHNEGAHTGQLIAIGRAHIMNDFRGAWIGGGAGRANDGSSWRNVVQGEAAAWARFNSATAFASVTPVAVADSIRYTDAQISASLNLPVFELGATGGHRSGGGSKSWGNASVTAWVAPRIAIVASAGTYPVDFTQGFPGGRFASLSLRIGMRRFPPATSSIPELEDLRSSTSSSPLRLESRELPGGQRRIRLYAPKAASVELMADFTDWKTVKLENTGGGWWSSPFHLTPGIHELNVRIDAGPWITPPGLPSKTDEFGGSVGILIIRARSM